MQEQASITAREFCQHHQIETNFIQSLQQYGLIAAEGRDDEWQLSEDQLNEIEKMVRLHYDLQINLEGIDAIYNLLRRMEAMQQEIVNLKNKLRLYEL